MIDDILLVVLGEYKSRNVDDLKDDWTLWKTILCLCLLLSPFIVGLGVAWLDLLGLVDQETSTGFFQRAWSGIVSFVNNIF